MKAGLTDNRQQTNQVKAGGLTPLGPSLSTRFRIGNTDITWLPPGDSPNARKYRKSSQAALREGIARAERERRPIRIQLILRAAGLQGDAKQTRAVGCAISFNVTNRIAVRYIRRRLDELARELDGALVLADEVQPRKR